jgi:hypothetical protein
MYDKNGKIDQIEENIVKKIVKKCLKVVKKQSKVVKKLLKSCYQVGEKIKKK